MPKSTDSYSLVKLAVYLYDLSATISLPCTSPKKRFPSANNNIEIPFPLRFIGAIIA